MTNPTRQEIIDAHNALEKLGHMAWNGSEDMYDKRLCALWKKQLLAALPPKPKPTMAEVEWDDDEHFLAEAETEKGLKVIMLHPVPDMGILCLHKAYGTHRSYYFKTDYLTPNGKRYTLTETTND